jgi:hypothetical protein
VAGAMIHAKRTVHYLAVVALARSRNILEWLEQEGFLPHVKASVFIDIPHRVSQRLFYP